MRKRFLLPPTLVLALALVALAIGFCGSASAAEDHESQDSGGPRVVAAHGAAWVGGKEALVEVLVVVPAGSDAGEAARAALREQGARELGPPDLQAAAYSLSGLVWNQLSDSDPGNNFVTQNYNPANGRSGAYDALKRSQATWTNVATSSFVIRDGGTTNPCPSLVRECQGPQYFDGNNDVGWLKLGGNVLGVTWYSTSIDEADMALNTRFKWYTGTGIPGSGQYDAETVYLHENGHVAGLGHSGVDGAVMEPYYEGVRRSLHRDDIDGISALYP